jgi:signal transduction histidine kinase/putative methionine-R-sulfoxide reductase with GAF domain
MSAFLNFLRPGASPDQTINRRQRLLFEIQRGLLIAVAVVLAVALIFDMPNTARTMMFALVALGGSFWLSGRGRVQPATMILLVAFILMITWLIWNGNGIHDIAVIAYPVILIIASLLCDRRSYLVITGLIILSAVFIISAELSGFHQTAGGDLTDPSDLVIVPVILGLVAWPMRILADNLMLNLERSQQLAVQQAALLDQTSRRAELLATLNRVGLTLTADMGLNEVLQALYRSICEVVATDSFYVALYDRTSGLISFPVFYTPRGLIQAGYSDIHTTPGLSGEVILQGRTLYLPDIDEPDVSQSHMIIPADPSPTRTYLGIPLVVKEQVIGLMSVQSEQTNAYNSDQISLLETIASQAAIAVERARLYSELQEELAERARAEAALRQRDTILEIAASAAQAFLLAADWRARIQNILERLGQETRSSHAFLFENHPGPDGQVLTSMRFEWTAPDATPDLDNPGYQNVPLIDDEAERWLDAMQNGKPAHGTVASASPEEAKHLRNQGILSYLNMPVLVGTTFWGYIGFDDVNHERVWVEAEVDALKLVASTLSGAIQRQRTEQALRQLNAELEQRVQERTAELESFAYSVAHDLRAPLRGIDGYSKLLLDDYSQHLDEDGRFYIDSVRSSAQWMGQLIEDLLRLSRVTRVEMHLSSVDIGQMAEDILKGLTRQYPDRQVQASVQPGLIAWCDAGLLRLALENLLWNAWKFTGRNPQAFIEVGSLIQDDQKVFYVRDNGVGFDMKYASKLFGAFQRLHSPGEFEGTGIGLATVRRIIQRHTGEVWAEGLVNRGATFYFTLPEQ